MSTYPPAPPLRRVTSRPGAYLKPVLVLAAALSLASCGTIRVALPEKGAQVGAVQLITLQVLPGTTKEIMQAAYPQATVLSLDSQTGDVVLSVPSQGESSSAFTVSSAALSALGARVTSVESDGKVGVLASSEGMGMTTWAGGTTTWAGGNITWAGSKNFLSAADHTSMQSYWDKIGLTKSRQLVPEEGAGIKIAVLDTGADLNHPLLAGRLDISKSLDYIDGDTIPAEEEALFGPSMYGHGTAVTGLILQVAPNATIMPYRVLDTDGVGNLSKVVQALGRAVDAGANIINLSLGSETNSNALNTAIATALSKGVMVINSSGNTGLEGMLYPARNIGTTQFPRNSGFLGVGSVNMGLYKSGFTSYGLNMSLTAPGENLITAFPDGRLVKASGTSFVAPAITGAVAVAMSAGVRDLGDLASNLRSTTTPNLDSTYKSKLGTGTLNVGNFVDRFR